MLAPLILSVKDSNYKRDVLKFFEIRDYSLSSAEFVEILQHFETDGYLQEIMKLLANKFKPETAHLLLVIPSITNDFILQYPQNEVLAELGKQKQDEMAIKREEYRKQKELKSKMSPEEKIQFERARLVQKVQDIGKECPPMETEMNGCYVYSFFASAKHTPQQVANLYPNLQGHNFIPIESEFGLIDVNYLISKVVCELTRNSILRQASIPTRLGAFSSIKMSKTPYPVSLNLGGIEFSRLELYQSSGDVDYKREQAEKRLQEFDLKNNLSK
jgi:hypothetical protein